MTSTENVVRRYAEAPNASITAGGVTYAYRELGPRGGIPVVLFMHLTGTLDNWDPRIVDAIAARRHVIAFDQPGVGASTGRVPRTLEESADDAYAFIAALGHRRIDVVGFSMGAMIAQDLVVKHPDLVRTLVLTGTGPRGGKDIDKVVTTTYLDIVRSALARADAKEFLFFNRNSAGRTAGREFIARLQERTAARDDKISLLSFQRQLLAIARYGRSAPADLSTITAQALIANGDNDRMVPSVLSEDLHRRIPGSRLIIYPDSGHGAVFQYHEQFTPVLVEFLGSGEADGH